MYKKLEVAGYLKWPFVLFIYLLLVYKIPQDLMSRFEQRMFTIGLATLASANILFFISAAANRMDIIGVSFISSAFIVFLMRTDKFDQLQAQNPIFNKVFYFIIVLMIPKFIFQLSFFLSQTSIYLVVAPFIPIFDSSLNLPIIDAIKFVLGLTNLVA